MKEKGNEACKICKGQTGENKPLCGNYQSSCLTKDRAMIILLHRLLVRGY